MPANRPNSGGRYFNSPKKEHNGSPVVKREKEDHIKTEIKPSPKSHKPPQQNKPVDQPNSKAAEANNADPGRMPPQKKFTQRSRLFVGNLPIGIGENEFKDMFKRFGEISETFVNSDKGFGFVRMDTRANAEKAKWGLDGTLLKNRPVRVRFATHGAALSVKNLSPFVSNELLEEAFSQFGQVERAVVIVDDRGRSTERGIVEFARKASAMKALQQIKEGCFLLTSSPRAVIATQLEQEDSEDGLQERNMQKSKPYFLEREAHPRFAQPGTFEEEFARRWKALEDLEQGQREQLNKSIQNAREKLEAEMENAIHEHKTMLMKQDWCHENLAFQYFMDGNICKAHEHAKQRSMLHGRLSVERFMPYFAYSCFLEKYDEFLEDVKNLKSDENETGKITEFCTLVIKVIDSVIANSYVLLPKMHCYKQFVNKILHSRFPHIQINSMESNKAGVFSHSEFQNIGAAILKCVYFVNDNMAHFKQDEVHIGLGLIEKLFEWYCADVSSVQVLDRLDDMNGDALQRYDMKSVAQNIFDSKMFKDVLKKEVGFELSKDDVLNKLQLLCQAKYFMSNYEICMKLQKVLAMIAGWLRDPFVHTCQENQIIADSLHGIFKCWNKLNNYEGAKIYLQRELTFRKQITRSWETDTSIAKCYFQLALCSLRNREEVKKFVQKAKLIWMNANELKWRRLITACTILLEWLKIMQTGNVSEILDEFKRLNALFEDKKAVVEVEEEFVDVYKHFVITGGQYEETKMYALSYYKVAESLSLCLCGRVASKVEQCISNCLSSFETSDELD